MTPPRLRAQVEPEVLVWARETRGLNLDEAARRIGVNVEKLRNWERAEEAPTVKQLRKASRVYVRPISLFFLDEPPEDTPSLQDFRRFPLGVEEPLSAELMVEIRLAHERRFEALDLAAEAELTPPQFSLTASPTDAPEAVAEWLRETLRVTLETQTRWSSQYQAFTAWRAAIENLGVLVFQTGRHPREFVEPAEARGFSLAETPLPVIVANGKDWPTARCFTILHELVHLLLRNGGLCDLHDARQATSDRDRIEQFCNYVAGAVLVPSNALVGHPLVDEHDDPSAWSDSELGALARRFWVSWEVILRRLVICERASLSFYQHWREENQDRFPDRPPQSREIRLPMAIRVLKRNGKLYSRIVLDALQQDRISMSRAADYLGAGPQHLGAIGRAVP